MFILLARLNASLYNGNIMNIDLRLWAMMILFIAVAGRSGLAQDQSPEEQGLDAIKHQMISAAQRNHELAIENKTLKAQLVALQMEVERYHKDVAELDRRSGQDGGDAGFPASRDMLVDDPLVQEAQAIYLSGRSMDIDEEQRLREIQLYDLQYRKQELQMDLQSKESIYRETAGQRKQELNSLRKDIQKNEEKEKDLYRRIAEAEKVTAAYPAGVELLKMENQVLRQRINNLKYLISEQE
jgi:predicted RNase H-like nuclease (RuvC/YqgF family)